MYWNNKDLNKLYISDDRTLTWDVLKFAVAVLFYLLVGYRTLTWDVLKSFGTFDAS